MPAQHTSLKNVTSVLIAYTIKKHVVYVYCIWMHVYVHSHTCAHINVIRFSGKIPIKDFLEGLNKRNSVVRVFMSLTDSAFLKSVLFKKKKDFLKDLALMWGKALSYLHNILVYLPWYTNELSQIKRTSLVNSTI